MDILGFLKKSCEKTGQTYENILENYVLLLHEFIRDTTGIIITDINVELDKEREKLH